MYVNLLGDYQKFNHGVGWRFSMKLIEYVIVLTFAGGNSFKGRIHT